MEFLSPAVMRTSGAEYYRQSFHIIAPVGVTIADLQRPEFWTHNGGKVKPHDVIDVIAEDGSFDVTLRVVSINEKKTDVTMRVLRLWEAAPVAKELAPDAPLEVSFAPSQRWRVIRKADGSLLHKGMATRAEATAWALDTMRVAA